MIEECVLVNRNLLRHAGDPLRARSANNGESDGTRKRKLGRDQNRVQHGRKMNVESQVDRRRKMGDESRDMRMRWSFGERRRGEREKRVLTCSGTPVPSFAFSGIASMSPRP